MLETTEGANHARRSCHNPDSPWPVGVRCLHDILDHPSIQNRKAASRAPEQATREVRLRSGIACLCPERRRKRFLESLTMEQRTPYGRILGAAQVSVILVL